MIENINPDSDLWMGEQYIISELASSIPEKGTIVEIGTFKGGTAQIFNTVAQKRNIEVFTIDINPNSKAFENLKKTDVKIIEKSSTDAAKSWQKDIGKSIDLLFIDGSHIFQNVFQDFNSWINFVKPSGMVIFHDYDPIERGGLVHLGVKICVDTIDKLGLLKNTMHRYKLYSGIAENPQKIQLNEQDCYSTLVDLSKQIVRLQTFDFSDWTVVCDDKTFYLLKGCLKLDNVQSCISPRDATDPKKKYLVLLHPLNMPMQLLERQKIPKKSITLIDSLKLCYIVNNVLDKKLDYLLELSINKAEFMKCKETLDMLNHAFGKSPFPEKINEYFDKSNIFEISKLISREQVKLSILARMVKTMVHWTP